MPFLVRWPGRVEAGSVCKQTICFTDMLSTFAGITGQDLPEATTRDSVSILPLLSGREEPVRDVTVLHPAATVVRVGKWKLITHLGSGGFSKPRRVRPESGEARGQLYDLDADPAETKNLWKDEPEVVTRLTRALEAARR